MLKKTVIAGLAIAATMTAGAGVAMAAREYVGGGIWDYGTGGGRVWSDYYHGANCHSSSVDGAYYETSGPVSAGRWAYADAPDTIWVDSSYWNNAC